jgi:hypothetical protein
MRCDQCKFWHSEKPHIIGECTKAKPFWEVSTWTRGGTEDWERKLKAEFRDLKMFCQDGSDYRAYLLTKPDFYCAHFEGTDHA